MKMKKMLSAFIAAATLSTVAASMNFVSASAPEVVAVAGLRGQAGTYNYWGADSNSGNITAKDANIDGNAQFEAVWDITGDGTGSIEFLILELQGPDGIDFTADVYPDLSLTVDEIYVDGVAYEFTQNDAAINLKYYEGNGRVRAYLTDTWSVNGGNTLGLASDQPITSQVKVVFTVDGLYTEGTSNVTETVPPTEPAPTYTTGDVDADGNINALDASMVLTEYASVATNQGTTLDEIQALAAETNGDGNIDALDASEILSYYSYTATGGALSFDEWMAS